MEDNSDYQPTLRPQPNSHYSHHSIANSTQSWVYANQQNPPGPPPPQPVDYPSPVKTLRPLPNPHAPNPHPLRVVNNPEPEPENFDDAAEFMNIDANDPGVQYGYQTEGLGKGKKVGPSTSFGRPQKKKTFVGGFVKGIRRLPKAMFGYGVGTGGSEKGKLKRTGTYVTEGTSTSATEMTGNTLPLYTSNPPTPVAGLGRSAMDQKYIQRTPRPEPTFSETPLPDVVRLSMSDIKRHHPSFRVTPPSDDFFIEDTAHMYDEGGPSNFVRDSSIESSYDNPAERTTFMVYNDRQSQYQSRNHPTPHPTPPIVSRQISTSPGLSYVSEPLAPVRSTSFHSSLHAPPPIEIPQTFPGASESVRRVSYASQIPPRRDTPQSLIPGAFPSSNAPTVTSQPQPQTHVVPVPEPTSQVSDAAPVPAADDILSPVSAHPGPTADYLKMTLSPSPTSHATITSGGTSAYYDPSFSSQLSPVEKFFKTLYHMPWVSHNRVTVDYAPGEGVGKRHSRKIKPMMSWYRSILARSRRNSATSLDLLSSGTPSPRMSLGAGAALLLSSPEAGSARRSGHSSDKQRNGPERSHNHHDSSPHQHQHAHSSRPTRKRPAATWMDSPKSDRSDKSDRAHRHRPEHQMKQTPSPLIPPVYPFQFPPYPYPGFQAYPVPVPAVVAAQQQQQQQPAGNQMSERPASPRGPRALQQQPVMYAPPVAGYASYQPMVAPPQVYLLQPPTSPMQQVYNPPATEPNLVQQPQQPMFSGPGIMYMQTIPGSF